MVQSHQQIVEWVEEKNLDEESEEESGPELEKMIEEEIEKETGKRTEEKTGYEDVEIVEVDQSK